MTEAQLQKLVADYLHVSLPDGSIFHHSPNEGKAHIAWRIKQKKAGMRTGWPDLEIFCPGVQPIFIELKVGKNRITPDQNKTLNALASCGCVTAVCKTLDEVRAVIEKIVKLKERTM
jgi:hypothetical protein